jgi:histidine transport system substrate-binding protein
MNIMALVRLYRRWPALLLTLAAPWACAGSWGEIRLATESSNPPFSEVAPDGALRGMNIDIGNALCAELKARCSWVRQDWDTLIPSLVSHKFDAIVASMSITAERRAKVAFTDKYYTSPLTLVARIGTQLQPTAASLQKKTVGVQRGTVPDNFATHFWDGKGPRIVRYAKQDEAFLDLAAGRVDAVLVDYLEALGGFLAKNEERAFALAGDKLYGKTAEEKVLLGDGIGIAVRKRDDDLREQLNQALAAIRANGVYDQIRKKYFKFDIYNQP